MTIDLRLGRWQDVLADVDCDALITDPPYSERTDSGYMSHGGSEVAASTEIGYPPITQGDAEEFAAFWLPRTKRWAVIFGDHISRQWHADAWERRGWYVFAPVIWVKRGAPPRFRGDGPASQVDHIMVARPRKNLDHEDAGSRPGWYFVDTPRHGHAGTGVTGNKCLDGMTRLVSHYSRAGDLVCDPFAGSGTTARAADRIGRNCVAAEVLPKHMAIAEALCSKRRRGVIVDMFAGGAP